MTAAAAIIGLVAMGLYLAVLLIKTGLVAWYVAGNPDPTHGNEVSVEQTASVVVLQPILSGDPELERTLRENVEQATGDVQFRYLIDDDDAEGQAIGERLCGEFPERVVVQVCAAAAADHNPKSHKLQLALEQLESTYVAVLDDDTRLLDDNLARAVGWLERRDLYTGLPCYEYDRGCWSALVAHFVNNNSILTYLPLLPLIGPVSLNGMFYVTRADFLDRVGGFEAIHDRLCDDYALAALVRGNGGRIHQGITPQRIRTTVAGARAYVALMHRWFVFASVLVADQKLGIQLLLGVVLGLPPLLLWLSCLAIAAGWFGGVALTTTVIVRHLMLRGLQRWLFRDPPLFSPTWSLAAEFVQPLHWLHAACFRVIRWRTRRIRVHRNGSFTSLEP